MSFDPYNEKGTKAWENKGHYLLDRREFFIKERSIHGNLSLEELSRKWHIRNFGSEQKYFAFLRSWRKNTAKRRAIKAKTKITKKRIKPR